MAPLKVIHLTPFPAPTPLLTERRETEVRRIFGRDVEIVHLSEVGMTPAELLHAIQAIDPDAIVIGSAASPYREAIDSMPGGPLILHPVLEEYRTLRGEIQQRHLGFGVMRAHGRMLLADGALAARPAIDEELAVQRRHRSH